MKQGNLAKEMQSMPNLKEMDNNSCRLCSTILFIPKSINLEISRRCQLSKRIQSFLHVILHTGYSNNRLRQR